MRKKSLLSKLMLLLLVLLGGVGAAWAETSTVTASKVTSSSVSWTGSAGETWAVTVNGGATNQNVTNEYAQIGTRNSPSSSITLSTSGISGTISSVVINCASYNGLGTVSTTVGGSAFGTQNQSIPSWSSNSGGDVTFSGSASGAIVITMTNGTSGRAMYIKSITVTYTTSGGDETLIDPTITFSNGSVRVGNTLDLTTLFSSNSTGTVTYSITAGGSYANLSGSTLTATAEGSVTVKAEQAATSGFNAGEASATITVNPALELSSIAVTTPPTKTTYNEGETFSPTGMVVTATYTDKSTEAVIGYTYSPNSALTTSDTEITISYTENSVTKTATQAITVNEVVDYTTLPFNYDGGVLSNFRGLTGTSYSLNDNGSYAEGNAPYRIKFTKTGDYLQIKTNERPGVVTVGVKMIGGSTASSITVQESADGETFTDVQTLSISGSQNSTLTLSTSADFAETSRYVRLYFTKGSNVGVGPISIAQYVAVVHNEYDLTVSNLTNVNTYIFNAADENTQLLEGEGTVRFYDGTNVLVSVDVEQGYVLQSLVVDNEDVTSQIDETGAYTFTMPTHDVAITATAEIVVTNTYTQATSITSGKHYVIANTEYSKVMGVQNTNNRTTVEATLNGSILSVVSTAGATEFAIYGPDVDGFYTIYDANENGYLYAASSGSNYLKTQTTNDDNGRWKITFNEDNEVSIVATKSNNRNVMQYNNSNSLFSCYGSASQKAISLFEKVGEAAPTEKKTLNAYGYATYCSQNALDFSNNSNVTAWAISSANSSTGVITFSQLKGKVAAGTGMLLKGDASTEVTLTSATGKDDVSGNLLIGTTADFVVENNGDYYGLSGKEFVPVNAGTVPAGKALLPASEVNNVSGNARLSFVFEDDNTTTGISEELRVKSEESFYNLNGQRVNDLKKGGLYIVGGKKVIVK